MSTTLAPSRGPPVANGLAELEAAQCFSERGPVSRPASSRSYGCIVIANVLTLFNAILAAFRRPRAAVRGPARRPVPGDRLRELGHRHRPECGRNARSDRLSALVAPTATVIRGGRARRVPVENVVVGDAVTLEPGDQLIADAVVAEADGLRLDESILTGESESVVRVTGEEVRSGSFVV